MREILCVLRRPAETSTAAAVDRPLALEIDMRSNSGKDESRNNLRDPTLRDRELGRDVKPKEMQRTTELGSGARKSGQRGEER